MYEHLRAFCQDTYKMELIKLRGRLLQESADDLREYLQLSGNDTTATGKVLRELVTQALNAKAAEGRKAGQR